MRISDVVLDEIEGRQRLSATVEWHQAKREAQRIYFETDASAPAMHRSVMPFVIGASVPAMAAGEAFIESDEPIDAALFEGVPTALAIIGHWCRDIGTGWSRPVLRMPVATAAVTDSGRRTACFYSGGVDATFTLLRNHAEIPVGDVGRISAAIMVLGLDLGFVADRDDAAAFDEFVTGASPMLREMGVAPIVIRTNVRQLDARPGFWGRAFNGFPLSAIAQLFPAHFHQVHIGTSTERLSDTVQQPWGSHPVIHAYLNTASVQGRSPHVEVTRLNRTAEIARVPSALTALRVCFKSSSGLMNCGRCEKCVRTRLALVLAGKDVPEIFGGFQLSPEHVRSVTITSKVGQLEHEELRDGLRAAGLHELASAEDEILRRWARYSAWREGRTLGGRIRRALRLGVP